jgi:uncharacterized protein
VHNWSVFLRLLYQVPFGTPDPVYGKDIGFYLFSLPAYIVIKNYGLSSGRIAGLVQHAAARMTRYGC